MKGQKFRRVGWVGVLLAIDLLVTGCADTKGTTILMYDREEAAQEEVDLTFFGYKADAINLTAIEDALHGFMEENSGVRINYEGMKGTAYWTSFDKRVAADVMDDLFMIDHDRVQSLGTQGKLADLREVPGLDLFNQKATEQFTEPDGSVYFLPTCISTFGLYVNYDLLEEHGQKKPENLSEFVEVCDYFVSCGITPIIANNYSSLRSIIVARGMYSVYQEVDTWERIQEFNRNPALLAELLEPGLELADEMIARGWVEPAEVLVTAQTSDDLKLFCEGKRPFMITGGWASPRVAAMNPDFEFGIYPYPILEDGSVLVMDVNTCVAVNGDTPYLAEALSLVAYLIQPDVLWEYCDSQSSYTPLVDERIPSDQAIAHCVEYLTNGRSVIGSDYRLQIPLDSCLMDCCNLLLNGCTITEVKEELLHRLEGSAR